MRLEGLETGSSRRRLLRHQGRCLRGKRGLEDAVALRVPKNNRLLLRRPDRAADAGDRRRPRLLIGSHERSAHGGVARSLIDPRQRLLGCLGGLGCEDRPGRLGTVAAPL